METTWHASINSNSVRRRKSQRPATAPSAREERDAGYWIDRAVDGRRMGLYELALKYYSRALELDKSLVVGWLGQVQMLVLLDEHNEAELWARKSLELFPNNGDLLAGRAHALSRMGDMKRALGRLRRGGRPKRPIGLPLDRPRRDHGGAEAGDGRPLLRQGAGYSTPIGSCRWRSP